MTHCSSHYVRITWIKEGKVKDDEKAEEGKDGSIDESERAFSPSERRVAEMLQSEGKHVKASAEGKGPRRSRDALVDGIPTEFKTPDLGANGSTIKNQINDSTRRGGQARNMIIDARGSGLTEAEAMRGLARAKNITRGRIDSVRVIGDGFDITSINFQ
jgi:hypothetical protein